jgi:hypothetical protein
MWKNTVEPGRQQTAIRWIPKATDTHLEYVIFVALPLQQWFQECTLLLRFTYIACVVTETVYCAVRTGYCHVTLKDYDLEMSGVAGIVST